MCQMQIIKGWNIIDLSQDTSMQEHCKEKEGLSVNLLVGRDGVMCEKKG